MRKARDIRIKCPVCGAEYLPAEIYIPKCFVGSPENIDKNHYTQCIESYFGKNMDLIERYKCDNCDNTFKIIAKVQFITIKEEELDFKKPYKTKLNLQKITLDEN